MNTQGNRPLIRMMLVAGALAGLATLSGCCWGYGYGGGCWHGGGHWGGHCH